MDYEAHVDQLGHYDLFVSFPLLICLSGFRVFFFCCCFLFCFCFVFLFSF